MNDDRKKRQHFRYKPIDNESIVAIDSRNTIADGAEFNIELYGLLFSEAYGGFGAILRKTDKFQFGDKFYSQVGKVQPLLSEIVWRSDLDDDVIKIGVKYLE